MSERFTLKERVFSFKHPLSAIKELWKNEHNMRLHFVATLAVLGFGFAFNISATNWLFVLIATGLVWIVELLNTALEQVCNFIQPKYNKKIKYIKDIAALAVLVSAALAAIIGIVVFTPYVINLWK